MNESDSDEILKRLQGIEAGLRDVIRRIEVLERSHTLRAISQGQAPLDVPPPPPPPPPVVFDLTREDEPAVEQARNEGAAWSTPVQPIQQVPPKQTSLAEDVEYKIGAKGMLWAGTVAVVTGLIFLVAYAISNGWITLQMQFGGEIALCLAFIGIGLWKREEKEEFGLRLIGIGSCGLYLSFAGAHVYKHVISGETLVLSFVALSLINLGLALWRSSRTFLVIGLVGGLIASALPIREDKVALSVSLHFLILAPALAIVLKNRWQWMALATWPISLFALGPALFASHDWPVRLGALYASTLLTAFVYAKVYEETPFDPHCAFVPSALMLAGLIGIGLDSVDRDALAVHGSLHTLILTLGACTLAPLAQAGSKSRNALLLGAVLVALVLTPCGYPPFVTGITYAAIALVFSGASLRLFPRTLATLAWLEVALAVVSYGVLAASVPTPPPGKEIGLLIAAMVAASGAAIATWKSGSKSQPSFLAAAILILPLLERTAFLGPQPGSGLAHRTAMLAACLIFSWSVLAVGATNRWAGTLALGWISVGLAALFYGQLALDIQPLGWGTQALILVFLMATSLGAALGTRKVTTETEALVAFTGALLSLLLVRLSIVLAAYGRTLLSESDAAVIALLVVSGAGAVFSHWKQLRSPILLGWVAWAAGSALTLAPLYGDTSPSRYEAVLLFGETAATVWLGLVSYKLFKDTAAVIGVSVAGLWILLSRLAFVVLTASPFDMKGNAALTSVWIAYAVVLISLGFRLRLRPLRYWSFGVFGLTILKVFAVDLSGLDPAIRVVLLLVLGIAMLAGGYGYIRMKAANDRAASDRTEEA